MPQYADINEALRASREKGQKLYCFGQGDFFVGTSEEARKFLKAREVKPSPKSLPKPKATKPEAKPMKVEGVKVG